MHNANNNEVYICACVCEFICGNKVGASRKLRAPCAYLIDYSKERKLLMFACAFKYSSVCVLCVCELWYSRRELAAVEGMVRGGGSWWCELVESSIASTNAIKTRRESFFNFSLDLVCSAQISNK